MAGGGIAPNSDGGWSVLEGYQSLMVRQQVEPLQVFSGLETQNRYQVLNPEGHEVCLAYEESGFMARQFLRCRRPLTINVIDGEGNLLLVARGKFYWFFSHLEFFAPAGEFLGRLNRSFSFMGRRLDLLDNDGIVGGLQGPLLRPYTFWLRQDGREVARITKQWSGLAREMFTVADTFQVLFTDESLAESVRWLVLGTAFAIDLDFFERRNVRSGLRPGTMGGHSADTGGFTGRGF